MQDKFEKFLKLAGFHDEADLFRVLREIVHGDPEKEWTDKEVHKSLPRTKKASLETVSTFLDRMVMNGEIRSRDGRFISLPHSKRKVR